MRARIYLQYSERRCGRREELTVRDFIPKLYILLGINHDFLLATDGDNLCGAIRVAGMVNETPRK